VPVHFPSVFHQEFAWVWRTLRRLGVREADVEDLVHDVFVVFHRTLDQYDPARPLRAWLFGIAFRVASDHRRRATHRRELLVDTEEPPDSKPTAEAALGRARAGALVLEALAALPEERRAVFVLCELDELGMPEVAATLGIPLNTGYSRLRIARREFTDAVRRITRGEAP
jgi:RNA polymerase sigma-70 factor (ECF subfamily)